MVGYVLLGAMAVLVVTALAARAARVKSAAPAPNPAELVGALGTVVTEIPDDGVGEVTITTAETRLKVDARAENPIGTGSTVVIVDSEPTAVTVAESGF